MRAVLFLLTVILLVGCASPPKVSRLQEVDTSHLPKVENEAKYVFTQAERNYQAKNFDQASSGYKLLKKKFPIKTRAHQLASFRLASILYYSEQYPAASSEFEYYLTQYPKSELTLDATYNLAASEYQSKKFDKTLLVLSRLSPEEISAQGPRRAEVVFALMAQSASHLAKNDVVIRAQSKRLLLPQTEDARDKIEQNISAHLEMIDSTPTLEQLLADVKDNSTRNKITQRMARLAAQNTPLPVIALGTPNSNMDAQFLGSSYGDPNKIGVILPLSGKMAAYGKKALEGILLASEIYRKDRYTPMKIVIEDSQSNPVVAGQAVESLYKNHKVLAILGPLSWKESLEVGETSQELGVVNISLAGKAGVSEKGVYLFQNAFTPRVQLESLVRHCIEKKKIKRFAILSPKSPYGEDMANEFLSLVESMGGRIYGYETYATDQKDFQKEIQKLTGLADPRFRKDAPKLAEHIKKVKEKTGKDPKAKLEPVIAFDALFIPDTPKTVAQIAASLSYFDVHNVKLLGTTEWNTDQLYKRGGKFVEGSLFPGGLHLSSNSSVQKDFIRRYQEAFGSTPDLLAAQSYEAMRLIMQAVQETRSGDRNLLVKELTSPRYYESPLGNVVFGANRIANRNLPIFSLEAGGQILQQN